MSFVLISFTVSAQDFWKKLITNSSFNEIAMAMIETADDSEFPAKTNEYNTGNFYFDAVNEPSMELETWMTSGYYFYGISYYSGIEAEVPLSLEPWMLNESNFEVENEVDNSLELEEWMISNEFWATR